MENKKTICKYKSANSYIMTCEPEEETQVEQEETPQPAAETKEETTVKAPEMTPAETTVVEQTDAEEIAVPIVGDTDESYVEPLGETYTQAASPYENVVNYQYGTSSQYTASLLRPEEGFTASDIALIVIIALSLSAIIASVIVLTGRKVSNRASRKNFIQK